jgi:hypothetical protein
MIKTQIQLPDRLYHEAKRVAQEREISLAEVLRRGVEYITRVYPPLPRRGDDGWQLPEAAHAGLRPGVRLECLRDLVVDEMQRTARPVRPGVRRTKGR